MNVFKCVRLAVYGLMCGSSILTVQKALAETGEEAWLRYAPVNAAAYANIPARILVLGKEPTEISASTELQTGLSSLLKRAETLAPNSESPKEKIVLGTKAEISKLGLGVKGAIPKDGYAIRNLGNQLIIEGESPNGTLYGAFAVLRLVATEQKIPSLSVSGPSSPIRWTDEWDNPNGTIERGFAGPSIFFEKGHVRSDLTRAGKYARLLASIGINGVTINNVNSDIHTLSPEMIREFARIADAFRPWGVRLSLSVDLSSPKAIGGLSTFDPIDPTVIAWWQAKVDEIYQVIPDFAGFTVKADSEGRPGPSQYGRSPADAANAVAKPLLQHGGFVLYRGFVYNNHLDWNDLKADRARAGADNFVKYDGTFLSNVVIQVKLGPIDFQVREPVSPLFAALRKTPKAIELQPTQEYTGQQRHMVYLVPQWKTSLETDMRVDNKPSTVREIIEGKTFHQSLGGFVAVAGVGMDISWMHHPMAMANIYGFGRLAWDPTLSSEQIIEEWTRQTWSNDPQVVSTIDKMQLESWKAYEDYTGPLGIGGLTDIVGAHYGPGIESAERNGWGQWFRGDKQGIGMDRTVATGTGYIGQYPPQLAAKYESLATCPDELLLFMHHVPYNYKLHSGKTLIQHVYDTHYEGAAIAASYAPTWETLKDKIDPERYQQTWALLHYQFGHSEVWRDAVDDWFKSMSGIDDDKHRVGNHPGRIEAEVMSATGYVVTDPQRWETASGGKAVVCREKSCTLSTTFDGVDGAYQLEAGYYDMWGGKSHYDLTVNGKSVAQWAADNTVPIEREERRLNGSTATRYWQDGIALKHGDAIVLHAVPDGTEQAPFDFLQFQKQSEAPKL